MRYSSTPAAQYVDILDERDRLGGPALGSLLFHAALIGAFLASTWWLNRSGLRIGSENVAAGAYTVSAVSSIPIPHSEAPPNPVANDTRSLVPTKPEKEETKVKPPPPPNDAYSIDDTHKKKPDVRPKNAQKYAPLPADNQVFASTRQAASNPMYTAPQGSNGVGISENTVLGARFGAYADLLRQRITAAWQRNGLDPRSQHDPAVISLVIMQNGSVRDIQLTQTSGNPAIDNSALRALYQANPLPPLPPGLGSSFPIQFTFNLK
jgi:periplasmic protein TonB